MPQDVILIDVGRVFFQGGKTGLDQFLFELIVVPEVRSSVFQVVGGQAR